MVQERRRLNNDLSTTSRATTMTTSHKKGSHPVHKSTTDKVLPVSLVVVIVVFVSQALVINEHNISNAIYITNPPPPPSQQQRSSSIINTASSYQQMDHSALMNSMQPPSITPFWFNQNVQENQRMSVLCVITSGDLPVSISWLKDGQLLTPQLAQARKIVIKNDEDQSTIKFQPVKLDHAGNYTCLAQNKAGKQMHSAQLVVLGESRWLNKPQQEPIVATRGQTIVIDCQTTGWPKPQQTWWIKPHLHAHGDFEPLAATGRISLAANGSLVIRNADKSDEANYLCKSFNGIGKEISSSTSLKVTVPAHFESPKQQTNVVRRQSRIQLRCDAFGDEPITIEWFKNKQKLSNEIEPRYSIYTDTLQNRLVSQLVINQVQRHDNSIYECVTKNSVGKDRLAIDLVVQEEPDNIQELQASQIGSRSVQLMWNEPYDGRSSITQYMFQYKRVQDATTAMLITGASPQLGAPGDLASASIASPMVTSSIGMATSGSVASDMNYIDSISALELAAAAAASAKQQVIPSATNVNTAAVPLDNDWQQASRIMVPVQPQNNTNTQPQNNIRSYTIDKLEPSSKYVLRALAINSIGQSKFSQPMEFNTDEEAPEIGPTNIRALAINSTSVQVSWDEIPKSKQLGRIHGYYIGYRVTSVAGNGNGIHNNNLNSTQNFIYKPYIINDLVLAQQQQQQQTSYDNYQQQQQQRLETTIHDLRRDTAYEITVVAFNSRGSGPSSDSVVCKTIEMEAPKPVKLQIRRESNESIFIEWQRDPSDQNPVDDYILYQEKNSASQEWLQVRLPGNQTQYKAPGLKCGTRYQFYIIAHNKVGKSQPSEVVGASTSGALPVIPSKTSLIKMVNSTCLLVNLNSFQDNGCRIKTFTVRYRIDKITNPSVNPITNGDGSSSASTSAALIGSNGMAASHGALVSSSAGVIGSSGSNSNLKAAQQPAGSLNGAGATNGAANGQSSPAGPSSAGNPGGVGGTPEWITIRPRSSQSKHLLHHHGHHGYQRVSYEEDRMEYLCDLNPIGEYTIHVAAANDVGRSEIEYSVLMSSDELRHSALNDLVEFISSMPNIFIYVPSIIVFLLAGLFMSLASIILYTTALKYYQKFVIMHNQLRATRRAKQDEKRRRKLNNQRHSQKLDLWADEYEEEEDVEEDVEGDDEGADDDSSASGSGRSNLSHGHNNHGSHHNHLQHQHHHGMQQRSQQQSLMHHHQSPAQLAAAMNGGHYLSNISNSAFETSSIDSHACNKFGVCSGMSTASTDSMQGRFQCLNSRQYVKMNEYTILPSISANLSPQNDIYGTTAAAAAPQQAANSATTTRRSPQQQQQQASPANPIYNPMYSTLRRTSMQTYLPQQQQQQQQQPQQQPQSSSPMNQQIRRQSQNINDIYGYYIAPPQPQPNQSTMGRRFAAHQQAANEAANSIFVPPQQIIYSAPNLRRQPPVFL